MGVGANYLGSAALGGGIGSLLGLIQAARINSGYEGYGSVKDKEARRRNLKAGAITGGIVGGLGGAYLYGNIRSMKRLDEAREAARRARNAEYEAARNARQAEYESARNAGSSGSSRSSGFNDREYFNEDFERAWDKFFGSGAFKKRHGWSHFDSGGSGYQKRSYNTGSGSSGSGSGSSGRGNSGRSNYSHGYSKLDTHKDTFKKFGENLDNIKTKKEYTSAYRRLVKKYHTDVNNISDDKIKEINNAHDYFKTSDWYQKLAFLMDSLGIEKLAFNKREGWRRNG